MIVNNKYKLGALLRSGDVATFEAEEMASGRGVYVHLLAGAAGAATLAAQVRERMASPHSSPLIEQGDYEGSPFVVSDATPELLDLKRWIEGHPAGGSAAGRIPGGPSPAAEPSSGPGEFTRMFEISGGGSGSSESQAGQPSPLSATGMPPSREPLSGGRDSESGAGFSAPPAAPPAAPEAAAGKEPGEFTRLFAASQGSPESESKPAAPRPPSEPAPPPRVPPAAAAPREATTPRETSSSTATGGEFTRLFAGSQASPPPETKPAAAPPPPAAPPAATGGPREPAIPKQPASSTPPEGEFTRLYREREERLARDAARKPGTTHGGTGSGAPRSTAPAFPEPPAQPTVPPPAPQPPREPSAGAPGEGEFTRMFSGKPGAEGTRPASAGAAKEPSSEPPSPRRTGSPAPPGGPGGKPGSGQQQPPQEYGGPSTWQTGDFTHLFGSGSAESEPHEAAPPPPAGGQNVSDSGMRRISPDERRQEMRQFRKVSHPDTPGETRVADSRPPEPLGPPPGRPEPPPPAASSPQPPPPASSTQPGEFTRLFQSPPGAAPPAAPPRPSPRVPPRDDSGRPSATQLGGGAAPAGGYPTGSGEWSGGPQGGQTPKTEQTGEFTKLFRQGKPSPPAQQPPPGPQAPPAGPSGAGEFTRLFGAGGAPGPSEPWGGRPQQQPQASEPGSFTRLFGGGGSSAASGPPGGDPFSSGSPWPGDAPQQPVEPENQPGEFTRLFGGKPGQGSGGSAGTGSWSDKPRHDPGGATQISSSPVPQAPAPPPPPQAAGPSDYTRMMGSAPPAPRQQGPTPQAAAPQAPPPAAAPPAAPAYPGAPPAYPGTAPPGYPPYPPTASAPLPQAPPQPAPAPAPPAAAQPQRGEPREREASDRSMYLILALVFCALLVVALGIVLFVSLTGERDAPPAPDAQTQQGTQAPATSGLPRVSTSTSVPGVTAPSVSSGSISAPSVSAPSVTAPSVSSSGVSAGSVTAPSVSRPSVSAPSVSSGSVSHPSMPNLSSGQAPAASTAAQPAGQASGSSGTPFFALIIVLSVLLVIAVGAAVYFALRRA